MATPSWKVAGQYYETCSCDFVCPCVPAQLTAKPSKGSCTFAMGFKIEQGKFGQVPLDGLGFMIIGFTPEEMGKGNWSAGVIVDERASTEQRDAIVAVASGAAGGPMAALSGLITNFVGIESAPIRFERDGVRWSVNASNFVRMSAEPAMGLPVLSCGADFFWRSRHEVPPHQDRLREWQSAEQQDSRAAGTADSQFLPIRSQVVERRAAQILALDRAVAGEQQHRMLVQRLQRHGQRFTAVHLEICADEVRVVIGGGDRSCERA